MKAGPGRGGQQDLPRAHVVGEIFPSHADIFSLGAHFGHVVIADFIAASGAGHDILLLTTPAGAAQDLPAWTQEGANAVMRVGAGDSITIVNETVGSLARADIKFV